MVNVKKTQNSLKLNHLISFCSCKMSQRGVEIPLGVLGCNVSCSKIAPLCRFDSPFRFRTFCLIHEPAKAFNIATSKNTHQPPSPDTQVKQPSTKAHCNPPPPAVPSHFLSGNGLRTLPPFFLRFSCPRHLRLPRLSARAARCTCAIAANRRAEGGGC